MTHWLMLIFVPAFLAGCYLPTKQVERTEGRVEEVPNCTGAVDCGVLTAAAVGTKMLQTPTKVTSDKAGTIQCRIAQTDTTFTFPCGATTTIVFLKDGSTEKLTGAGEYISVPASMLKETREIAVKTRGCPNTHRIKKLTPGSIHLIVFQSDCSSPL